MKSAERCIWCLALVTALWLNCASALYEDQIKKFDWRRQYIGALSKASLELNAFQPRLLVSTEENVIASICPKTGELIWRQVLEDGGRGKIKFFQVNTAANAESSTAAAHVNSHHGFDMLTVQGYAPALVRGWNSNKGSVEWEWSLVPLQLERAEQGFWFYSNAILYHVLPSWKSHLEVTPYYATTGQATSSSSKISAAWINAENCVASGIYYVCLEGNQLISLDLTASQPQVLSRTLNFAPKNNKISPLEGVSGVVVVDNTLVNVKDDIKTCGSLEGGSFALGSYNQRRVIAQVDVVDKVLHIQAFYVESCQPVEELKQTMPYPDHYGVPHLKAFDCKLKRQADGKGCVFILGTEDEAMLAVQQGKVRWAREESLANVIATEFMDLPLADTEGTLEKEIKGKTADIVTAFMHRLTTQMLQVKSIFLHVIGLGAPPSATQRAGLVRDSFGLHKMLVILTRSGKIFGIDNINGKHHWQQYLASATSFANGEHMRLIVQRTSKHFPLPALCTIVAKDKLSGNGVLYRFNPITGQPAEGGLLRLNYEIKQLALLTETENEYVKGILVIDRNDNAFVYPESSKRMADGMFLYTADRSSSVLQGFQVTNANGELSTTSLWNVQLGGEMGEHKIIALATKNSNEKVHSQGRVLSDRSVLYKYVNPNLIAVITQANDSIHKYIMNTYLIDVVSGAIVFSMTHRKVRGPVQIVHSENWLAYAYYNDKVRRTEITTIELYEGKTQANNSVWSSLDAPQMPMVERQSYILPTLVEAMRETITERGITNKDILIGTAYGAIIEMPWILLDPRRPLSSTTQGREEGAIPYIPELPLPTENIINYNQTVSRLRNIFTAPSGLESTCLMVATGLDMFVTRVAPSKSFDLLKDDFDYILITIVLLALTTGSLVVKHLASKKLLKQAWK